MLALTYSHLLEKRSINKLEAWLRFTEIPEVLEMTNTSTSKLYDALTFATNTDFEGKTQKIKHRRGKDGKSANCFK